MKRYIRIILASLFFVFFLISHASATSISLFDWAFYVDGTTYEYIGGHSMPTTGSLDAQGLGSLSWTSDAAGDHTFIAFFDHEIDELENTYFNEYGSTYGRAATGQSWEIDEPGYVFGDIYYNVLAGSLDNMNSIPPSGTHDDVSMALGWDFTLTAGQSATIDLSLAQTAPGSGFYLTHTDPDSNESIYFSSTLNISGGSSGQDPGPQPIPEPGTMLLMGTGVLGFLAAARKRLLKRG